MANRCTWSGCACEGVHAQFDKSGRQWASLCPEHDIALLKAVKAEPFSPAKLMRAWIDAQGGPKAAAAGMSRG